MANDLHKAELISLPVTLAILLLAGLLVAGARLLLGLSAVLAAIVGPVSQLSPVSESIHSVVLLIRSRLRALFVRRYFLARSVPQAGQERRWTAAASQAARC